MDVLVVDDDPTIRSLLASTLASEGWDVHTAEHGRAALETIRTSHPFDVIVLDLDMPVMDGRAFYRELRAQQFTTPVLLLSENGSESAREELGANAALEKPVDPFVLTDRVKTLLGL